MVAKVTEALENEETAARIAHLLAHPVRLRILSLLREEGPM